MGAAGSAGATTVQGASTQISLPAGAAANSQGAGLVAVSCVGVGSCTAIGSYDDSAAIQEPMVVDEQGGVWGTATAP